MTSALLIRSARKRAKLSQAELAEALGLTQGEISRWESGKTRPSHDRLLTIIRATGFDLSVSMVPYDTSEDSLIAQQLAMSPRERLDSLTQMLRGEASLRNLQKVAL